MKTIKIILGIILITFCNIRAQHDTVIFYPDRGEYEISYWTNIAGVDTFMTVIFIPSNKVIPKIEYRIKKKMRDFIYSYKITNLSESKMPLETFALLIDTLINYRDLTANDWSKDDTEKVYNGRHTWFGHYEEHTAYGDTELKINQSKDGFIINSENLPGIGEAVFQGRTPWYTLSEEETSDFLDNVLDSLSSFPRNYVLRKTIVPVYISPTISNIDFLDTLKSYINQSFSLRWITDKKEKDDKEKEKSGEIVKELMKYLDKAREQLVKNKIKEAKKKLEEFVEKVEESYQENDKDEEKEKKERGYLTDEAYALLKYNAEYLISQIK